MRILTFALLALSGSAAAAQDFDSEDWLDRCRRDESRDDKAKACEVRELALKPQRGPLSIDPDVNGGVSVVAWDRDSIAIFVKVMAWARSDDAADALVRDVEVVAQGSTIRAAGPSPSGRGQSWSVSFHVYVPRRTDLTARTTNGPLEVDGVKGTLDLAAHNGPVSLVGVAGDVRVRVQNGPLHVELDGDRWDGAGLDAETVNGPAVLAIPAGYSARLETGTVNGPLTIRFPLTVTIQGRMPERLSTTLGQGGAPVRVVTTNGPMVIRRP